MMLSLLRLWFRVAGRLAPALAARHAARLFMTPGRHARVYPEAETFFATAERGDRVFEHGRVAVWRWRRAGAPKVLVLHGWSDHAANLLPLLRRLHDDGFEVYALDWPAHGTSDGALTNMREWLLTLRAIAAEHGPWHAVVAHSLGAFCAAAATRRDMPQFGPPLEAERLVLLAPPENSLDMLHLFAQALHIPAGVQKRMQQRFSEIIQADFADFSLARILTSYPGELLLVHDEDDARVPFAGFERIRRANPRQAFMATRGLGHRKLLKDTEVIERMHAFLVDTERGRRRA